MRREARLLLDKAFNSLVLSIEFFNRPHDRGRVCSSLILLDHAFEMFLKAAILHRGGKIRERRAKETIGFDACVRRALSDGSVKFLSDEQVLLLQTINGLRDAAQHHLLDVSEGCMPKRGSRSFAICCMPCSRRESSIICRSECCRSQPPRPPVSPLYSTRKSRKSVSSLGLAAGEGLRQKPGCGRSQSLIPRWPAKKDSRAPQIFDA